MALSEAQVKSFKDEGYLILPDFADDEAIKSMRQACHQMVDGMNPVEHNTVFSTEDHKRASDEYFMTSGDKIRFFYEEGAKDNKGDLVVDKHLSINKIGHALHAYSDPFKKFTFSEKVQGVAKSLGMEDPVVCQSMYIFKQPYIGGEVTPHQDSTFLYTEPQKLVGYWLALEDTTLENGCLWFIPGSHKDGIHDDRRFVRNPNKAEGEPGTIVRGHSRKYDDKLFIPGPVKKGTLVLIHGEVVHKSEKNTSENSRHIYTFHIFDQYKTEYSAENWLQPTEELPFPRMYAGVD